MSPSVEVRLTDEPLSTAITRYPSPPASALQSGEDRATDFSARGAARIPTGLDMAERWTDLSYLPLHRYTAAVPSHNIVGFNKYCLKPRLAWRICLLCSVAATKLGQ